MINVLYINVAAHNFDGATYSLMNLIESVKKEVYPIVLLRSKGCIYDFFTKQGIECIVCDFEQNIFTKPKSTWQYIKFIIKYIPLLLRFNIKNKRCNNKIYNILKDRNIKIVHTNNSVITIGCDIAKKLQAKHVWHFRGFMDLDFGWYPLKGWKNLKKKIKKADAIIGVSNAVLTHFVSPDSKNSLVIYDAVRSKSDTCLLQKKKYFLFCSANLCKSKGIEFAIQAFALSKLAEKGYRLRVVGKCDEKYMNKLEQLALNNGIIKHVDFIGHSDTVKEHMKNATAFLMCSENEGLGRVTIEAMFYGCLVIGRNSGGTKEIVNNEVTGLLFNNLKECAILMNKCSQENYTTIIENAQEYAKSNFSKEDYGKKILTVYKKVLNKSTLLNN